MSKKAKKHFKLKRTIMNDEQLVANSFRKSPPRGTSLLQQMPSRSIAKMIRNSPSISFYYEPKRTEAKHTRVHFDGKYHFSKDQRAYDKQRFETAVDHFEDLQHAGEQTNALDDQLSKILRPATPEKRVQPYGALKQKPSTRKLMTQKVTSSVNVASRVVSRNAALSNNMDASSKHEGSRGQSTRPKLSPPRVLLVDDSQKRLATTKTIADDPYNTIV